jgi:c(7)-type cytochrome triheme protein
LRSPLATRRGAFILVGLLVVLGGIALWTRLFGTDAQPVAAAPHQVIVTGIRKLSVRKMPSLVLPADYTFPKADSSPGPVVFSHQRHIKLNANACTNCHPRPYQMAKSDIGTIECEYGRMNGCGHCHNGTGSFDIKEGCRLCHRRGPNQQALGPSNQPLSWRLADRLMPNRDRDFGPVFFSHRAHVTAAGIACGECHPAPYAMKRTDPGDPSLTDRESYINWGHRCGICHDGVRAFAQEEKCASCHLRWSRQKPGSECVECEPPEGSKKGGALEVR